MTKVLILGSGNIGSVAAKLLHETGDYHVTLASRNKEQLHTLSTQTTLKTKQIDVMQTDLVALFKDFQIIISALAYHLNTAMAHKALEAGVSYFDLTEDRQTTQSIMELASKAKTGQIFMPQCGLAPGAIGIIGHGLSLEFDSIESLKMRVGALPLYPSNELKYNLSWSTKGLINEYCNPCEILYNGKITEVLPLEGLEHFTLDGVEYEAFNTSGGLGQLSQTLQHKALNLSYKSIRYKGHRYLMHFLLQDLGFIHRQDELAEILERSIPKSRQDVVLLYVTIKGMIQGAYEQHSYIKKIYYDETYTAIEITTAHGLCAAVDLFVEKKLPQQGFIHQEAITMESFLNNRFGSIYQANEQGS